MDESTGKENQDIQYGYEEEKEKNWLQKILDYLNQRKIAQRQKLSTMD